MILIQIVRVRGDSLAPQIRDRDYVLITGLGLQRLQPGDVIVFDQPEYGRLIKRVERLEPDGGLIVRGDDIDSVDSRRFGPVRRAAVRGRVLWRIPASFS